MKYWLNEIMSRSEENSILSELDRELAEVVRKLFNTRLYSGSAWELSVPQLRAMAMVANNEDCTMGELARSLGIGMSTATGLIDRLVQHGLVTRDSAPGDRRVVCLHLTAAGSRALAAGRRKRRQRLELVLRQLSAAEQKQVAKGIALLHKSIKAIE